MGLLGQTSLEARMQHLRAGARLNSRIKIAVEWVEDGRTLRAEGHTVDVSPKGCLATIPQGFPVGQRLRLINLTNFNVCECILIWRGHEGRTGWELGLELQNPSFEYWGLEF